ncbi:hypothetical protein FHS16_001612 [Paenibacillus endophyticus]|uniref:Uncharacterized protein n=1 Tax=Paenibacillus endophyticus TaxID=1294268 RepID=A0A7W5C5P1_9BACL|nr:DUF5682 family protein [Paenibacillus endophyticus]MBB3151566.1 hypothetical protein [Paenibacillus endophyticus]
MSVGAAAKCGVHIFGIRHLSPAGAIHLIEFLNETKPQLVLVEGPSDATKLISQITLSGVKPPIAILAYTEQLPIRTVVFPLAEYSPEYQAFHWAAAHGAEARFIDLPSDVSVSLHASRRAAVRVEKENAREFYQQSNERYKKVAALAGEPDYDTYWERHFEHMTSYNAYRNAIHAFSHEMRQLSESEERMHTPLESAHNEIREAYMRTRIAEAIASGVSADRIVVVTGAYHASALQADHALMTKSEEASLPSVPTKLTLMPYSYYKLSTHSGYGAGNLAPSYFELAWQCAKDRDTEKLPSLYLASIAGHMRASGNFRSAASVIEAVRLAESLASLHGGRLPTLQDLHDAAITCLGYGELSNVADALARTDIGTAIGSLPEGVSQTPIQDDLNRNLKLLKLEKYKTTVATDLELDLRENRRVKSEEAAFLDLRRSFFLERLQLLAISFAQKRAVRQDGATWAEIWVLRWTPEAEIEVVESIMKGETIELAAAFFIKESLSQCKNTLQAAELVKAAWHCGLPSSMEDARQMLQELAIDAGDYAQVARTLRELSLLVQFGDVRKMDTAILVPLLEQLFLRGTLLLVDSAACSDDAAVEMSSAIIDMHAVAQQHYDVVDDVRWITQLEELAYRDDRNAKLSGLAFALLLERSLIDNERLAREVSRRLSPGIPADIGAGWFEGLSLRNRYVLLSRRQLWEQLNHYTASLDDEQFRRSLVFLRRALAAFEPREKNAIAELLGDVWGFGALESADALQRPLTGEEQQKLEELNEFDFGDL